MIRAPRHSATVEIAGIVCRISCPHLKPILWAREGHPEFLSARTPDVELAIVSDDGYWRRGLPWIGPNTVRDVPAVSRRGSSLHVRTAYYRATIGDGGRRIEARLASGFRLPGLMRTLYALLLPSRRGILIHGVRVATGTRVTLVCGVPDGEPPPEVTAVVGGDGHYTAFATPFLDGAAPAGPPLQAELAAVYFLRPDAPVIPQALGPAKAVEGLLSHIVAVERTGDSVGHVLHAAVGVATTVPCYQVASGVRAHAERLA